MVAPVPEASDHLSALAWVQEELRRSLELANKALRRHLKETENTSDMDTVDPAVLRQARNQLHQSVGVLELVGLAKPAMVLRASEAALQRLSARPRQVTLAAVHTIEHGSFAVLDYITRRLNSKPVSTLSLFPQYRALQDLAGNTRCHPSDLWDMTWSWRALPNDPSVEPHHANAEVLERIEADLLSLMRGAPHGTAARMSDLFASLGVHADDHLATLWRLSAGFFEAVADGLLTLDVYSKRIGSRLLSQLRAGDHGEPSERLAHDMLFFCSQAAPRQGRSFGPRLAAVHRVYALPDEAPVDLEVPRLGRFDPSWVAQARKRITSAKDVWSAVAGGDTDRLGLLAEQFALVSDSLQRLYPDGGVLGRALQVAASQTAAGGREPPAELAMEMATALLYLDASIDDGDFDHPDTAPRINRLAQRIEQVRQGRNPDTLELWMEDLYRRVSDRQTMGSVVQELRASLSEVEKNIDQYFRDPAQRHLLIPVPAQLQAMRGVLSVLGLDQASAAVVRMRDDVDALASTEVDPQRAIQTGTFDRLADNLGALSFLIDMVSVQPQMAKSLFRFDPETGNLSAVVAREDRPTGFEAFETDASADARAPQDTDALAVSLEFDRLVKQARVAQRGASATEQMAATAPLVMGHHGLPLLHLDEVSADDVTMRIPRPVPPMGEDDSATLRLSPTQGGDVTMPLAYAGPVDEPTMRLAPRSDRGIATPPPAYPPTDPVTHTGLEDDAEMREVFLEEAREVLQNIREGLSALQADHTDLAAMTNVRRAFHTLKGSSRMVGLKPFGEAAWACEQLYNTRLAEHAGADGDLRDFTDFACEYFTSWVGAVADGRGGNFTPEVVAEPADALRVERRRLVFGPDTGLALGDTLFDADTEFGGLPRPPLALRVPGLPSAGDLTLDFDDARPERPQPVLTPEPAAIAALPAMPVGAQPAPEVGAAAPAAEQPALAQPAIAQPEVTELLDHNLPWPPAAAPAPDASALPEMPSAHADRSAADVSAEGYKQIGPLRIGIALFNIYLNEADELSRRLSVDMAEWALELHRPVGEGAVALAHSLAGGSGTVGFADLSQLARQLEHALERTHARGRGQEAEAALYIRAVDEIRRLLHLFAAGFLDAPDPTLGPALYEIAHAPPDALAPGEAGETEFASDTVFDDALSEPELAPAPPAPVVEQALPVQVVARMLPEPTPVVPEALAPALGRSLLKPLDERAPAATGRPQPNFADALGIDDGIDTVDAVDDELFPIFVEEATELLAALQAALRDWSQHPDQGDAASACMRSLHTFKGGARLAGAMRLGDMAHRTETAVSHLAAQPLVATADVEQLLARVDALAAHFDALRGAAGASQALPGPSEASIAPAVLPVLPAPLTVPAVVTAAAVLVPTPVSARADRMPVTVEPSLVPEPEREIDWRQFGRAEAGLPAASAPRGPAAVGTVRVRAQLLDRLVNQAGEVSIARSRIETDVQQLKASFGDLTDNLERLRSQLRDIELQAETQITTRMEAARSAARDFDPLEMDRFTRFQELTRMMAESVSDVATVQRGLQRAVQSAEDALAHQARMTHDMQDDLLRTRMVEFEALSERLYRVVRQAAKETGKPVRLDIVGGSIEIDRGVLDRMTPAFEHLLRNSVVHGIESAEQRATAGKTATGTITLAVNQAGNEVMVEVRDDGAGLNLPRIRERAQAVGLLSADAQPSDADLANLVFLPGFTTASGVTDLAGRGVGMDVVRTDVNAMGGRIETASAPGQGASFKLVLPLTTAVTQVVMLRCGARSVAVPATLVEIVRRVPVAELNAAYAGGQFAHGGQALPFLWLDSLLQGAPRGVVSGRTGNVVVIRSAAQQVALHVDEVTANQEVVIKNLGPQLSRLPGLVGMTLLPSGVPALIYNPVALVTLYGESARAQTAAALARAAGEVQDDATVVRQAPLAPLVMVVDDSLTVRRVTQRLLEREGYRVLLAKDGLDALERLSGVGGDMPAVVLTDIEMPRMDGFDLVRNLKADERLAKLPLVMITSRIAQKHRDYAVELGVDHYLGKPYAEDELLALVARYARATEAA